MRNFKSAKFEHTKCIICDSDAPDLIKVGTATASQPSELYMCANQSDKKLGGGGWVVIALSSKNYMLQKQVFLTKLKEESTLQHRLKVFGKRIVAIKKSVFPKPVFRKKYQLVLLQQRYLYP